MVHRERKRAGRNRNRGNDVEAIVPEDVIRFEHRIGSTDQHAIIVGTRKSTRSAVPPFRHSTVPAFHPFHRVCGGADRGEVCASHGRDEAQAKNTCHPPTHHPSPTHHPLPPPPPPPTAPTTTNGQNEAQARNTSLCDAGTSTGTQLSPRSR